MLGPAQPFRLLGTECRRDDAIWPGQSPFRGLVDRPEPWRRDRQNAALPFDQDVTRIGGCGGDEGEPAGLSGCRLLTDPFRQGAGFAETSARKTHQRATKARARVASAK